MLLVLQYCNHRILHFKQLMSLMLNGYHDNCRISFWKRLSLCYNVAFKKKMLAFDFCQFCMVIRFFPSPPQWPPTDFYTRSYPLHYFLILILEKEPVFPFSMLSAKQGKYWYHFHNVFGMTRSKTGDWTRDLPHSKPALYH